MYLINARTFLLGRGYSPGFELFRPPLVPYLISLIWRITGVSYDAATLVQPLFAVAGAYVLFLMLKDMFNLKSAVVGCLLLSVAPIVFQWTDVIEVQCVGMCFLLLVVYMLWLGIRRSERFLPLAGGALALATLARYTILLLVPVFPLMLLTLWVGYGKRRKFPWRAIGGAGLVFFLLWLPWLYWNYANAHFYNLSLSYQLNNYTDAYARNPFASVILGSYYIQVGPQGPWYFYIENIPYLLTIPGSILLLIGLVDKKTFENKARLILLLYLAAFFIFSSASAHKELRYSIEWTPPLAAFAALGFSRIEARLPSRTKILAWMFVGLWLATAFYPAVTLSLAVSHAANRQFAGGAEELVEISAWIKANTSGTEGVATDFQPAFNWQSDRYYYSCNTGVIPIPYLEQTGITADKAITTFARQYNITLFVVSLSFAQRYGFTKDPDLTLVKQFPDYRIYSYHPLNYTQT